MSEVTPDSPEESAASTSIGDFRDKRTWILVLFVVIGTFIGISFSSIGGGIGAVLGGGIGYVVVKLIG